MWCMKRTNIYLDEEQTESLDRLAEQEGVSRAELIRRLIDGALTGSDASRGEDLAVVVEAEVAGHGAILRISRRS